MIYTVTFNPAIDYVVHTDAMTVGNVNRSSGEEIYFGGKGHQCFHGAKGTGRAFPGTGLSGRLYRNGH